MNCKYLKNLNTSHVKVKLLGKVHQQYLVGYLNTSHVKVKQNKTILLLNQKLHLNTSHVKVKHLVIDELNRKDLSFKYISC